MSSDREQELEQHFVRGDPLGEVDATVLTAQLAELARPVGQEKRRPPVLERRIERAFRPVVACACEPPACELVVAARIHAEGRRGALLLLTPAPYELRATHEPPVNRAAQRAVAERRVHGKEPR